MRDANVVSVVLSWYGGEYCGCSHYDLCRKGDVGKEKRVMFRGFLLYLSSRMLRMHIFWSNMS